jgi:hypothetical protein
LSAQISTTIAMKLPRRALTNNQRPFSGSSHSRVAAAKSA